MTRHGATHDEADLAVEYLTENRYIDDARYARCYAADKFRFNKWGKERIMMQLRMKRIPDNAILDAIDEVFDTESEKNTIESELAKKLRGIKNDPRQKQWEKLMRFAISRGYQMEISRPIISRLLSQATE